jgi:hypothetical protein
MGGPGPPPPKGGAPDPVFGGCLGRRGGGGCWVCGGARGGPGGSVFGRVGFFLGGAGPPTPQGASPLTRFWGDDGKAV